MCRSRRARLTGRCSTWHPPSLSADYARAGKAAEDLIALLQTFDPVHVEMDDLVRLDHAGTPQPDDLMGVPLLIDIVEGD